MYSYPIDYEMFNKDEIITIIKFLSLIENLNEGSNDFKGLKEKYQEYKKIINSKSLEKKIDKDFEHTTGYSIYKTIKKHF